MRHITLRLFSDLLANEGVVSDMVLTIKLCNLNKPVTFISLLLWLSVLETLNVRLNSFKN